MTTDAGEQVLVLTTAMMEELWDALRGADASVVDHARPGLTSERIEQLMTPTFMRLPEEAVTWWTFHDGSFAGEGSAGRAVSPQQSLLSLEEALARREMLEQVNWRTGRQCRLTGGGWENLWEDTWLPILHRYRPTIVCDCDRQYRVTTPLRRVDFGDLTSQEIHQIRVPSIGTMVQKWIGAIRDGIWTVDPTTGFWNDGGLLEW